jgi:hypothetical protein
LGPEYHDLIAQLRKYKKETLAEITMLGLKACLI